jgi:hypothetical protein
MSHTCHVTRFNAGHFEWAPRPDEEVFAETPVPTAAAAAAAAAAVDAAAADADAAESESDDDEREGVPGGASDVPSPLAGADPENTEVLVSVRKECERVCESVDVGVTVQGVGACQGRHAVRAMHRRSVSACAPRAARCPAQPPCDAQPLYGVCGAGGATLSLHTPPQENKKPAPPPQMHTPHTPHLTPHTTHADVLHGRHPLRRLLGAAAHARLQAPVHAARRRAALPARAGQRALAWLAVCV